MSIHSIVPKSGVVPSEKQVPKERFSRRKHPRVKVSKKVDWDFFSASSGAKTGFIEDLSQTGCLLRTAEPIDHRRWIRFVLKDPSKNLWFTSVGRAVRAEDRIEAWDDRNLTLHRYGLEFTQPLNPIMLAQLQEGSTPCHACGEPTASIPDPHMAYALYCVLCHLRKACHSLLVHDGLEPA